MVGIVSLIGVKILLIVKIKMEEQFKEIRDFVKS